MPATSRTNSDQIAEVFRSLGPSSSILEAGVAEATIFESVLRHLGFGGMAHAFDLSWSRIAHAEGWQRGRGRTEVTLCTGDLLAMPYADHSFDLVFTSHAVEPNGGRETEVLAELMRVARTHLVQLEPGWELVSEEARRRMKSHGYCRGLTSILERMGGTNLDHRVLAEHSNPINPTALTVVRVPQAEPGLTAAFACPRHRCLLEEVEGGWFSPEGLVVYPVLGGFPCLRFDNAVTASAYPSFRPAGTGR